MLLLMTWRWFATITLFVSLVVHTSTFLGVDPIAAIPGVMFITIAIFPLFIAALLYAWRTGGRDKGFADKVMNGAPRWLRIVTFALFAYGLVNGGAFAVLSEGGGPHEHDGKYVLQHGGTVLRELTEQEFHQHQAFTVRAFSGAWMFMSSAALMVLTGATKIRKQTQSTSPVAGAVAVPAQPAPGGGVAKSGDSEAEAELPPDPTTRVAGLVSAVLYIGCVLMILLGPPVLSVAVALPVVVAMVLAFRRRHGFPIQPFESAIGCLCVIANALLASRMGRLVAEFIYLAIYAGMDAALTHRLGVLFPKEGPSQMSDGTLLNNSAWSALMYFVQFPLFVVGTIGLTYLAEHFGRFLKVGRDRNAGPH